MKGKINLSKKQILISAIIVAIVIAIIAGILIINSKKAIIFSGEIAKSMTYTQVVEGDENIPETDYVKFDAFFLRDLDGDGVAEKLRGSSRKIGESDTLYMELNVITNGYLEDAVIEINNDNFYFQTAIPKDSEVKENAIGNNIKEIKLNTINNGTQKLLTGMIRSGDYSYTSSKAVAIGNDINKYSSNKNSITLKGTHVEIVKDSEGNETEKRTPINKAVNFDIDWHGTTKTEIPNYLAGIRNLSQDKYLENAIDEENNTFTVEYNIGIQETDYQLNIKKAKIETVIPKLSGYAPIKVEATGTNVTYDYNEETREFHAQKEAIVDENGIIAAQAYDGTYSSNIRYNRFKVFVTYPLDAYKKVGSDTVESKLVVNASYEGFNNQSVEFTNPYVSKSKATFITTIKRFEGEGARVDIYVGKYVYEPTIRYIVSKEKPLKIYNEIADTESNDTYLVRWYLYTGSKGGGQKSILKETKNGEPQVADEFVKTDGTLINMENVTSNVGIYFSSPTNMLGDEGWIKVYDEETGELLVTFTKDNWSKYSESNPYQYERPVKHIRVETSETAESASLSVYNVKELDDEYITNNISKEEFDNINQIKSTLIGYLGEGIINTDNHSANYEAPYAKADITLSQDVLSTQETQKNMKLTINANSDESINQVKWLNGAFLLKLPKDILDLEINSVLSTNNNVKILSYEQYVGDDANFIKINTENSVPTSFSINIDCNITPDPRIPTKTDSIILYSYNENAVDYWSKEQDIYDVNDNFNKNELIGKSSKSVSLVSPDSILTNESVTNYDAIGSIAVAPQVAVLSKEQRTADINIEVKNNYSSTISKVSILGRVPYENNKYTINGNEMGSNFTAQMEGAIRLPELLEGKATVYYSENGEATKDLEDNSNFWTTIPNDFSKVKSYMICLNDYILAKGEVEQFSYTIKVPENLNYNQVTYSHHGIYFTLDTPEGKYRTQTEPNKVGLMIGKKYNLELTKYQTGKEKLIPGATYSITEDGQEEGKTRVTGEDGKLVLNNLFIDKTYIVKEIKSPSSYELNTDEIKFTTTEENGQLKVTLVSGTVKNIQAVQPDEENGYRVQIEVEDEVKPSLKIIKTEKGSSTPIKGVRFKITGEGLPETGRTLTTNANGEANLNGLYIGVEYTLEEIKAEGYYLENPIKFMISNALGVYSVSLVEGNIKSKEITEVDGIPTANIEIENTKVPTYNLQINKVVKGETTPLAGAKFRLYKGTEKLEDYITDENGIITINNLYQYEADRNIDQTYTLKELLAPDGYSAVKDITFKVENIEGLLTMDVLEGNIKEQTVNANTNTVTITIEDSPSFKLIKKDGETGDVLPGTKFAIYNVDDGSEQLALDSKFNILGTKETINGKDYYTLTTNEKGEITADLREGLYKAIEVQTSDDKYELTNNSYYFGIGASREAKTIMTATWATSIGGSGEDEINSVVATSDGGWVAGGYFNGTIQVGDYTLTSNGMRDGLIIKYNSGGDIIWAKSFGGDSDEDIESVIETKEGDVVAVGYFYSDIIKLENGMSLNRNKGGSGADGIILCYNIDGELETVKQWYGSGGDYIVSVTSTQEGGFIVGGHSGSPGMELGDFKVEWNGGSTGIIAKYNELKEVEWATSIVGGSEINSVVETQDGGIVAGGKFYNNNIQIGKNTLINKGADDGFVVKYNNMGEAEWSKVIGGITGDVIESVTETQDGDIVAVGYFYSDIIELENLILKNTVSTTTDRDGMIIKFDSTGQEKEATAIGGNYNDYLSYVTPSSDGGYIVGGNIYSATIDLGEYKLEFYNEYDGIVIKYNGDGNVEWATKVEGGNRHDNLNSVVETQDKGILVGGTFSSQTIEVAGIILNNNGGEDGRLIKYSIVEIANPVTTSAVSIGGTGKDEITSVTATKDEGYVVGGYFSGTMQIGEYTLKSEGSQDGIIIKYNKNGEIQWIRTIKKNNYNYIYSISEMLNGNILVGGSNGIIEIDNSGEIVWDKSSIGNIYSVKECSDGGIIAGGEFRATIQVEDYVLASNGSTDIIIIRLNKDKNIEWIKSYGGTDTDKITSIAETSDGGYAVGGYFYGTIQLGENVFTSKGYEDAMILKLNKYGEPEWSNAYGTSSFDYIYSVVSNGDGDILVGGCFGGTVQAGEYILRNNGYLDGIIIKYDVYGNVKWTQVIGSRSLDRINSIISTKDGGILAIGEFLDTSIKIGDFILENSNGSSNNSDDCEGMIVKYARDGKIEWAKAIGGAKEEKLQTVIELNDGTILIGGYFKSSTIETDGKILTNKGSTDGMLLKIVNYTGVPEVQEITVENKVKEFKITTDVNEIDGIKGGSISGEDLKPYEKVKYGNSNTKEIKMIPDEDYEIIGITVNGEEHPFTTNEDGTYTMPIFENVLEDKHIVVTYSLKNNKIIINKIDSYTKERLTGAKFRLDQIEERVKPQNVVGSLTDNSNTFYEVNLSDEVTNVLGELTNNGTYYFVKNADGTLTPTNSKTYQLANGGTAGIQNVTANSYIPIDLTGKTGTYAVKVNANIYSESADSGYATINESTTAPTYSNGTGRFIYISGSSSSVTTPKDYMSMGLEGGKIYYLHLGYRKNGSVDTGDDQIVINSINLYSTITNTYNFKEENGEYKSTNQGKADTTSNSYIPIDLTGYTGKYNLTLKATVSSDWSDYGYATVTTTETAPVYNNSTGRFVYISGTSSDVTTAKEYTTVLQGGNKYYLHLGYYKNASTDTGDDTFTVSDIRVTLNDSELYHVDIETNSEGQAITQIPFGKYKLTEIKTPEGYEEQKGPVEIEFRSDGTRKVIKCAEEIEDEDGNIIKRPYVTVNENGEFVVENISKAKVIVQHYIKGTETKLAEDVILEGKQGESYATSPLLDLEKYELEKDEKGDYILPENASGIYTQEDIIVKYYYVEKEIPLIVHHYIEGTENNVLLKDGSLAEDERYFGRENEPYVTKPITEENLSDGYELVELPDNKDGIYSGEEVIVTYYYKKVERNIVIQKYQLIKEVNEETGEEIEKEVPLAGAEFTITQKPQDTISVLNKLEELKEIPTYITDENGKIFVKLGVGEYEITEIKAPEGYVLPENPTTTIEITKDTVDGDIIKIVNEKIKGKVIVHHYVMEYDGTLTTMPVPLLDGTEAQDEIKEGYIGDMYATKEKDNLAPNWKFIKAEGKTSGEYEEGTIEVIYYYQEQINVEDTISIEVTKKWIDNDIQALRRPNTIKFIVTPYVESAEENEVIKEEIISEETLPTSGAETKAASKETAEDNTSNNSVTEENKAQDNYLDENKSEGDNLLDILVPEDKELDSKNDVNEKALESNTQEKTMQNAVDTKTEDTSNAENQEETAENKEQEQEYVEQINENVQEGISVTETNEASENIENKDTIAESNSEGTENLNVETLEQYIFEFPNQPVNKEEKTTTYTLNGIYKYDKTTGKKIHYIVTEVEENEGDLKFYEPTGGVVTEETDEAGNIKYTAEIINTFKLPEENSKDIKVTKIWKDNNNTGKTRPSSLILDLIGRVENVTALEETSETGQYKEINRKEQSITATQNWEHTFTQNPIYDENGQEIIYSAEEKSPENNQNALDKYIGEVSPINEQNEIIITNTSIVQDTKIIKTGPEEIRAIDSKVPYVINYTVELDKRYEDNTNIELVDTLEYEVIAEKSELAGGIFGEDKKTVTWTGTYNATENKLIWDNDTQDKITTTITEDAEKAVKVITIHMEISVVYKDIQVACEKVINKVSGTVTLSNNATDRKEATCETPTRWVKDVVVNKLWNGDTEETRPDSITVQLKQVVEDENGNVTLKDIENGVQTILPKVTEDGRTEWTYTHKNLPRYDAEGNELKYTVDETEINYTKGEQVVENQYYCEKAEEVIDGNIIVTLTNNKFGSIAVTKVDSRKIELKLAGAEFKLERVIKEVNEDGTINWRVPEENSEEYFVTTGTTKSSENTEEQGTYTFENLKYGFYKLTETKAPEGYRISKLPIEVIEVNSSDEKHLNAQVAVGNDKKYSLPLTGGYGTNIIRNIGILVISLVAILFTNRKKVVPVKREKTEKVSKPIRRKK